VDGDTVLVAEGIYTGDGNRDIDFLGKVIVVMSENGPNVTIIDCGGDSLNPHRGFYFNNFESESTILQGFMIRNGYYSAGGGIYCRADPTIRNCIITQNKADEGGGIFVGRYPLIINCVFTDNSAKIGGAVICDHFGGPLIVNSILWGDYPHEIFIGIGSPQVHYSDIEDQGFSYWGEGNIDAEPLFRNPEEGDYRLMAMACGDTIDSPCIDAGHPDSLDLLLDCFHGLGTVRADMGAYGGCNAGFPTLVKERTRSTLLLRNFSLSQNYPNPFNPSTTIQYDIPAGVGRLPVEISIYDIRGRLIKKLVDQEKESGSYQVHWDGKDDMGVEVGSGICLYRIEAGNFISTRKMVLVR
jgi:hypothetical protein